MIPSQEFGINHSEVLSISFPAKNPWQNFVHCPVGAGRTWQHGFKHSSRDWHFHSPEAYLCHYLPPPWRHQPAYLARPVVETSRLLTGRLDYFSEPCRPLHLIPVPMQQGPLGAPLRIEIFVVAGFPAPCHLLALMPCRTPEHLGLCSPSVTLGSPQPSLSLSFIVCTWSILGACWQSLMPSGMPSEVRDTQPDFLMSSFTASAG